MDKAAMFSILMAYLARTVLIVYDVGKVVLLLWKVA